MACWASNSFLLRSIQISPNNFFFVIFQIIIIFLPFPSFRPSFLHLTDVCWPSCGVAAPDLAQRQTVWRTQLRAARTHALFFHDPHTCVPPLSTSLPESSQPFDGWCCAENGSLFPLTLYLPHLRSGTPQTCRQPGDGCSLKGLGQGPRGLGRACGGGRRPGSARDGLLCAVPHLRRASPRRGLKMKERIT